MCIPAAGYNVSAVVFVCTRMLMRLLQREHLLHYVSHFLFCVPLALSLFQISNFCILCCMPVAGLKYLGTCGMCSLFGSLVRSSLCRSSLGRISLGRNSLGRVDC